MGPLGVFATALALGPIVKNKALLVCPMVLTIPLGILTFQNNHQLLFVFIKFVSPSLFIIRLSLLEIPVSLRVLFFGH